MKRISAVCILGCALTFSAFAQNVTLDIGGYAKTFWIPYRLTLTEAGDDYHTTAVQVPWGKPNICAGINFEGRTEYGGFHLAVDIASDTESEAKISGYVWARLLRFIPIMSSLKIYAGDVRDSTLMGKVGASDLTAYVLNGSWANDFMRYRLDYREAEQNIFSSFNPYPWGNGTRNFQTQGEANLFWPEIFSSAMITWEPIRNLYIGAWVGTEWVNRQSASLDPTFPPNYGNLDHFDSDYYDAASVYRKIQVGAGYTWPGIGFLRLQYVGMRNTIEAAYQVLSVPSLTLDMGIKIPFVSRDKENMDTYLRAKDYQVSAGASWRYADFMLTGRVDTAFAGYNSYNVAATQVHGLNMIAYLIPSYQLEYGTLGMDFGFEYQQKDNYNKYTEDGMKAGAALWFYQHMGNARIKVALAARMPLNWHGVKQNFDFFIPIFIETGF